MTPASPRTSAQSWLRLLRWARPYFGPLFLGTLGAALSAGAAAGYAALTGPLLASLLSPTSSPLQLRDWALALLALATLRAGLGWVSSVALASVAQAVVADLRTALYGHVLSLSPGFFERRASGEMFARVTGDVAQVEFSVAQALSSYARDSLQVLALALVCLWLDPFLFAMLLGALPLAGWTVARFSSAVRQLAISTQATLSRWVALLTEPLLGLATLQSLRAEPWAMSRLQAVSAEHLSLMRRSLKWRAAFTPTLETIGLVATALLVVWGAKRGASDPAFAGRLISFLSASLLLYQPLKSLAGTWTQVQSGVAASERVFEILETPLPQEGGQTVAPLQRALRLENVHVTYPDGRIGLSGLTLNVPAGKTLALVGPSGAGKSTLFSLLLGFLAPKSGEVFWDDVPLSQASRTSTRAQTAWVAQEPTLLSGTVRQNLLLADPRANTDALWDALRRAGVDEFVRTLPLGLDAQVGEGGGQLSGGQRQRLVVARALLRQPSLLLLDEPTRSLDAESEGALQRGLAELTHGRTTVVIAHRLSTVERADAIAVLDKGALVELGTHETLLAQGGRYASLVRAGELVAEVR